MTTPLDLWVAFDKLGIGKPWYYKVVLWKPICLFVGLCVCHMLKTRQVYNLFQDLWNEFLSFIQKVLVQKGV